MGGIGSGRRWHYDAHSTTSDYRSIDVRRWNRSGSLDPGYSFVWQWSRDGEVTASIRVHVESDHILLAYRRKVNDDWMDEKYPVKIDWTDCHMGGQRPWFRCPARNCHRRVAILYGGGIFACGRCYRLAYPSQRETTGDRAARKADGIRDRMGWEPGILNGEGLKPKGMQDGDFGSEPLSRAGCSGVEFRHLRRPLLRGMHSIFVVINVVTTI